MPKVLLLGGFLPGQSLWSIQHGFKSIGYDVLYQPTRRVYRDESRSGYRAGKGRGRRHPASSRVGPEIQGYRRVPGGSVQNHSRTRTGTARLVVQQGRPPARAHPGTERAISLVQDRDPHPGRSVGPASKPSVYAGVRVCRDVLQGKRGRPMQNAESGRSCSIRRRRWSCIAWPDRRDTRNVTFPSPSCRCIRRKAAARKSTWSPKTWSNASPTPSPFPASAR